MIHNTIGIVLKKINYSDNSLIATILTEKFGLQSYMIYYSNTKKGKSKINLIQPFSILDMQVYYKETSQLQKVKDFSANSPMQSIPYEYRKNSVSVLLAEIIAGTLKDENPDENLFNFLLNSIKILDLSHESVSNFHIVFLFHYSKFLGIFPENNFTESHSIFDYSGGKFIVGRPNHFNFLDERKSKILSDFFPCTINLSHTIKISGKDRQEMLVFFIDYYNFHLNKPGKLKTLEVLRQVFNA